MDRFASAARKLIEAAALGLLATAPLFIPPVSIAARLDAWLFDVWARTAPATTSSSIAVATAETPAALTDVAAAAATAGVELIVTTLPTPVEIPAPMLIGPTDVAAGASRSRATGWSRGGAVLFEPELDGVVRRDSEIASSLAGAAAAWLQPGGEPISPARPLLRLGMRDALPVFDANGDAIRALVAGPPGASYATPAGVVTTPEFVALALNAHLSRAYIAEGAGLSLSVWLAALALAIAAALNTRGVRATLVATAPSIVSLTAMSGVAFAYFDAWLPVTGPIAWLVLTNALLASRRPAPSNSAPLHASSSEADRMTLARHALHGGQVREAWNLYRTIRATTELLPELYDVACTLQTRGADDEAAELFHRIALVDSGFRDVAHRLVHGRALDASGDELEALPKTIGRYELLEHIGRGAMGSVYLGRDPLINRILALKAIDLSIGYDHEAMESTSESFMREATIAGSLSHPNIVTIYDVGEAQGLAYIAMEYVRGHHLSEFAATERLLPVGTVLDLVARAADALDYAHRHNIVHRDIKPANIMYDWISNNLKITDFGIAKLIDANRTRTGIVLGTPAYMSPEQLEGRNVNGHTDLFALGVSLYQLLTGQLPFRGASMTKLMFVIANEPHEPVTRLRAGLSKSLDAIVDRALAKDPAARFQSGAEMAAALRQAA